MPWQGTTWPFIACKLRGFWRGLNPEATDNVRAGAIKGVGQNREDANRSCRRHVVGLWKRISRIDQRLLTSSPTIGRRVTGRMNGRAWIPDVAAPETGAVR